MLDVIESNQVVQEAIVQAGGYEGPHAESRSLTDTGLKKEQLRAYFPQAIRDRLAARTCEVVDADLAGLPNGPDTTIKQVADYVREKAREAGRPEEAVRERARRKEAGGR